LQISQLHEYPLAAIRGDCISALPAKLDSPIASTVSCGSERRRNVIGTAHLARRSFIEERRVIPIIGPELLLVQTDQGPRLRESQALLASLPARMKALNSVRVWTNRVREATG
jgi:hypothetical protein